jgi:hypothetical protein
MPPAPPAPPPAVEEDALLALDDDAAPPDPDEVVVLVAVSPPHAGTRIAAPRAVQTPNREIARMALTTPRSAGRLNTKRISAVGVRGPARARAGPAR